MQAQHADLLQTPACAIVNPANTSLLRGSGLCGVIHRHAGIELEAHCRTLSRQQAGDAILTPAFSLSNCRYIIHACGPRWLDGQRDEAQCLEKTYRSILQQASQAGLQRIALPAISTGIYRYPFDLASQIAVSTCKEFLQNNGNGPELVFVLDSAEKAAYYQKLIE